MGVAAGHSSQQCLSACRGTHRLVTETSAVAPYPREPLYAPTARLPSKQPSIQAARALPGRLAQRSVLTAVGFT